MSVEEVAEKAKQALDKLPTDTLAQADQALSEVIETLRPVASESTDAELHQAYVQFEEAGREIARILGICNRIHELVTGYLDQLGAKAQPAADSTGEREPDQPRPKKSRIDKLRDELPPPVQKGSKTHGRWMPIGGTPQLITSGKDELSELATRYVKEDGGRRIPTVVADVEMKVAAQMRRDGVQDAELVINNTECRGTLGCNTLVPVMLPEGYSLTVHGTTSEGLPTRTRYTGGARPPWNR